MKIISVRRAKALIVAGILVAGYAGADEVPKLESTEEVFSEESKNMDAITSGRKGGRVIEYGGKLESSSGVVPAVVQSDPLQANPEETPEKKERNINQKDSVKLITGGDPSDGNAKSGHLPVLD